MIIARYVVLEYVLKKVQYILLYLLSSNVENMEKIVRVDIERLKQKVLRGKLQKNLKMAGLRLGHSNLNSMNLRIIFPQNFQFDILPTIKRKGI